MNVFQLLKNVKEFVIGDFVVANNILYRVEGLPCFLYTISYTNGDWDDYHVDNYEEIRDNNWSLKGYWMCKCVKGELFRTRHKLFGISYELFDPEIHKSLVKEKAKMELLLSVEELNEE